MSRLFNKKELKALKDYEPYFTTIVRDSYRRAVTRAQNEFVADMLDATEDQPCKRNWSCSRCTYDVWLKAGQKYFKSLEAIKNKEK